VREGKERTPALVVQVQVSKPRRTTLPADAAQFKMTWMSLVEAHQGDVAISALEWRRLLRFATKKHNRSFFLFEQRFTRCGITRNDNKGRADGSPLHVQEVD
jgi:hypothetical protein